MALYHEAGKVIEKATQTTDSLSALVYSDKSLKSKPAQLYALVVEAAKWSPTISKVIEVADLLKLEKKLTPQLAIVLVHDLLLSKQSIALPKDHGLRQSIERHKARLSAEFTKARLRAGYATLDAWRASINQKDGNESGSTSQYRHPRWVRLNTLSGQDAVASVFSGYETASLDEVAAAPADAKILFRDNHIPHLLALPPAIDVTRTPAYRDGTIILQDKASCFSAYLLDPRVDDGDLIDACAAPGNKTTHLAALVEEARDRSGHNSESLQTVYACERDKTRAQTLAKMTKIANIRGKATIECLLGQDFLRLNPQDARFSNVGALLLDPSCSGTGIVNRTAATALQVTLPDPSASNGMKTSTTSKKRKRKAEPPQAPAKPADAQEVEEQDQVIPEELEDCGGEALRTRLANLSAFQLKIIQHAFAFPAAKRVVYSTCSIHSEENEQVVVKALQSPIARERGWRVLKRDDQVDGMKRWHVRGDLEAARRSLGAGGVELEDDGEAVAGGCIRCEKGTQDRTMGFFVAGFVRGDDADGAAKKHIKSVSEEDDDDWEGFDSD